MRSRFFYAIPSLLLALVAVGIALYGLMLEREAATTERPESSELAQDQSDELVETRFTYLIAQQAGGLGPHWYQMGWFASKQQLNCKVPCHLMRYRLMSP